MKDIKQLIAEAYDSITRVKGKEYAPGVHEIQEYVDAHYQSVEKLLGDYWVLISFKKQEGLSFHMKSQESISLIAMLLAHRPELWDIVKKTVWDIKKNKKP